MTVVSLYLATFRTFCPDQATVSCLCDVDLVSDDSMTRPSAGTNSVLCSPNVQTHTQVGVKETCLKWAKLSVFSLLAKSKNVLTHHIQPKAS